MTYTRSKNHTTPHPVRTHTHRKEEKMSRGAPYGRSSSQSRERARFEDAFRVYHEVSRSMRQSIEARSRPGSVVDGIETRMAPLPT